MFTVFQVDPCKKKKNDDFVFVSSSALGSVSLNFALAGSWMINLGLLSWIIPAVLRTVAKNDELSLIKFYFRKHVSRLAAEANFPYEANWIDPNLYAVKLSPL